MKKFDKLFVEMMAGIGGAFGDLGGEEHGGDVGNSDWYATGDARIPKVIGAKTVKGKKSKRKMSKRNTETIPILRRNLNIPM